MQQTIEQAKKRLPPTQSSNEALADRLVGTSEAARYCGFSVSHWRWLVKEGHVPPPIRLSERKLAWRISTLRGFIDSKTPSAA